MSGPLRWNKTPHEGQMDEKMQRSTNQPCFVSTSAIDAISGVHNGFVMNTLFFCLDTDFAGFCLLFLCQFDKVQ